jgi:hypothetical protein
LSLLMYIHGFDHTARVFTMRRLWLQVHAHGRPPAAAGPDPVYIVGYSTVLYLARHMYVSHAPWFIAHRNAY